MMAAGNGHLSILKMLLKADGANVLWKNEGDNTALHWAALNGHLECVKALIDAKADGTAKNEFGRRAFDEAYRRKHNDICEFLAPDSNLQEKEEFS